MTEVHRETGTSVRSTLASIVGGRIKILRPSERQGELPCQTPTSHSD